MFMKKIITQMSYMSRSTSEKSFPTNVTQQNFPSLQEILVKFKNGEDLSDLVYSPENVPGVSPLAQFSNRKFRVDPLTERQEYIKEQMTIINQRKKNISQQKVVSSSDSSSPEDSVEKTDKSD